MKKIASIIGARPQFIKAAAVTQALQRRYEVITIHTGQHYDYQMSRVFFSELHMPRPNYNLNVGSGTHGSQTGTMLASIEKILLKEKPHLVMVYGDTNSTLAGAIAAAKLHIPIGHVEAGMRSHNRVMAEEINRIMTDHISQLHFCSTKTAMHNLRAEGVRDHLYHIGDVMMDILAQSVPLASQLSTILTRLQLSPRTYSLLTIHRAENTDSKDQLRALITALIETNTKMVFPVHPRTKKQLRKYGLITQLNKSNIQMIDPVGYIDMVQLEQHARQIITDSGGIQKEAYFLKVPCITLRNETEWVETVKSGWNTLADASFDVLHEALHKRPPHKKQYSYYGSGNAALLILKHLTRYLGQQRQ